MNEWILALSGLVIAQGAAIWWRIGRIEGKVDDLCELRRELNGKLQRHIEKQ